MLTYSQYSITASLILLILGLGCYIAVMTLRQPAHRSSVKTGTNGELPITPAAPGAAAPPSALVRYGTYFTRLALVFLTAALVLRAIVTGHGPFSNQYEFALSFAWGIILMYIYFEHRYHARTIALLILPIASAFVLYAVTIGAAVRPLVPALQSNFLLTVHVVVAIFAYGAFTVSFAAAILHLYQPEAGKRGLPKPALLDEIGYRAVIIGFPLLTLVVVLGAVWAQIAWGTYWSWDPKETASLLTWFVYGAYLHARVTHGWRGRRASWLLVAGFACILLTFFGNLFFGGLHSYS